MRVVLVTDRYGIPDTRVAAEASRLAESLRERGHEVIIFGSGQPGEDRFIKPRARLAAVEPEVYYETFLNADIVHLFTPFKFSQTGGMFARQMKLPCLATFNFAPENSVLPAFLRKNERAARFIYHYFYIRFYQYFPRILCPNELIADKLRKHCYDAELCVIPVDSGSEYANSDGDYAALIEKLYGEVIAVPSHKKNHSDGISKYFRPNPENVNDILLSTKKWPVFRTQVFARIVSCILSFVSKLLFGLRTVNAENLSKHSGGAITVCNHVHNLDTIIVRGVSPRRRMWLTSLSDNFQIPVIGFIFKHLGAISLGDTVREQKSVNEELERRLGNGEIVHFYPEGMLVPYHEGLRQFYGGAFAMAVHSGFPIIPMVMSFHKKRGLYRLKRKPCFIMHVLPPIYPDMSLPKKAARLDLQNRVELAMLEAAGNSHPVLTGQEEHADNSGTSFSG